MRNKSLNTLNTKGFGLIGVLVVVAVLAVVGGTGAYVYHRNHKAKPASTVGTVNSKSSTSGKTSTSTATQTPADPYAGWSQYCSAQEKSCFKYPSTWATKNIGAVDPAGDGVQLTSQSGSVIWFQSAVSGLGGACQPGAPDVFIDKVVAAPKVADLYVIESGTQTVVNHIGLINGSNGQPPKTGDTGSCISETTFKSKHDASMNAWFESNGTNSLKSTDISTAELILESYTY